MQRFTLTPGAAVALFVAHRSRPMKSVEEIRSGVDAERWLVGTDDPLVQITHEKVRGTEGKEDVATKIEATFKEPRECALEDRVYEHLKKAFEDAAAEGKVIGWGPGMIPPGNAIEVADSFVKGAERFDAPKAAPAAEKAPRLVEGKKKAAGA